jgi:hypothetical protein
MTSTVGMNRVAKGRYTQIGTGSGNTCRISVRPAVFIPYGDLDDNNMPVIRKRPVRRMSRMQAAPVAMPRHERPVQGGLSLKTALCIVGFFVFAMGIITLVNTSSMTESAKALYTLQSQIEACQKENGDLAIQLEKASDSAKICYAAARDLGMVSAEGANTVPLTAPVTRKEVSETKAAFPQARTGIYAALFGFLD